MIYLDNNATTALDERVAQAMLSVWRGGPLNASSQHGAGRRARNQLDHSLSQLAHLLGGDIDTPGGDSLIVTSGGTESNNLAIAGLGDPSQPLVISGIEHPSVLEMARNEATRGREVRVIPVDADGAIDLAVAKELIQQAAPRPALVSVMASNNETGVIQPIDSLASICRTVAVPLHIDAAQSVGKLPIGLRALGVSAISATAHKFHGPAGIGLLLVRAGVPLRPQMIGGAQQLGKRAGTEAIGLVVGMAQALSIALDSLAESTAQMLACREVFESSLKSVLPEIVIHGERTLRLPGTSCLSLPGVERQMMLLALDAAGIACSSGSACASGSSQPSHVLSAMGVPSRLIETALRFGFSRLSTTDEASEAADSIFRCYRRLQANVVVEKSV